MCTKPKMLPSTRDLKEKEMVRITDVLELQRHSANYSNRLVEFVLYLAKASDGWRNKEERIKRLRGMAVTIPKHAGEYLLTPLKCCVDEDSSVRYSAREALDSINLEKIVVSAMVTLLEYRVGNYYCFVRHPFTSDSPTKQKTVPFVLHATSFQEFGRWSKDYVDFLLVS